MLVWTHGDFSVAPIEIEVKNVVSKFVTANGRQDTDKMPNASSPLRMVQFFWLGWRNARAYIARRGEPWPSIPFDAIVRAVDE
jgi:hypothetical protein